MSRKYIKFFNSDKTTNEYWNKLNNNQKKKMIKIYNTLNKQLTSFKEEEDIAFSMLMHLLEEKIQIIEELITITELVVKQVKPYEKIDFTTSDELNKW